MKFVRINVDNAPRTAARHDIRGVPAIYFYRNGGITDKAVGALSRRELEHRIELVLS